MTRQEMAVAAKATAELLMVQGVRRAAAVASLTVGHRDEMELALTELQLAKELRVAARNLE